MSDTLSEKEILKAEKKAARSKRAEEKKTQKEERKKAGGEKPKMDKKKKRRIIIAAVAAVLALFVGVNKIFAKDMAMAVSTTPVMQGDIKETVSASGAVASEEMKTYFSQINGTIGTIYVKAGDTVKNGEQMIVFDSESAEQARRQADLQAQASEGSYQNSVQRERENEGKFAEASTNLAVLEQQIADEENYIKELQAQLDKLQADLSAYYNQAATNISIYGIQLQSDLEKAMKEGNQGEVDRLNEEITNNSIAAQQVAYQLGQLSNDSRVKELQTKISEEQDKVTHYREYKAEMESQKASSEGGVMNAYQKSELEANHELSSMTSQEALEDYSYATDGILADFNGIVTELSVVEGAPVVEGTSLLTLANRDKVKVDIFVTKYDLEKIAVGQKAEITVSGHSYEGEVVKINKMATVNASGTAAVGTEIRINNPDDYIYLGIEAKVLINTQEADQVLLLPVECVNADKEGDFVYTVENGIVIRKNVITGISSDTYIEIKEGLAEGDQVISDVTTGIMEGMPVTAVSIE